MLFLISESAMIIFVVDFWIDSNIVKFNKNSVGPTHAREKIWVIV